MARMPPRTRRLCLVVLALQDRLAYGPTFEAAMAYGPNDIENVEADTPEVPGASDGATPPRLAVSGT
jgi:hypothetical protein